MTELVATTPGLYPLPDWAKGELSDLKGHQKGDLITGDEGPEVVDVYDRARAEVVDAQVDAGLDRVVEGQPRWDDVLAHPLTVHENVETGGIVRYYDNNNFYRDPQVQGELTPSGDVAAELAAVDVDADALQAVLPGPYSLADLATDDHYGDEADFLDAVADFLAGEVEAFPGHETLFLLEPSLVESPPGDDANERASDAIDRVAAATDADVVVHTYWGAVPEKTYAYLMDADVEAIGFDFVTETEDALYNINEYGTKDQVALGLVDGQNTLVESPETIRDRVEWVDERTHTDFERAYVTSNTELYYLPVNKFEEKLQALGDAAALAEVDA
ncbi:5-methyltetrahydropteroyltriglutamate--homocysteine methyltransferase [Haloplanus salinus]|jgi:5-methyltetrahydropteroyltriglutamate--homocysteine methyltransferase|uniref:5-methyltetrahydropteroyltriglutamate--homocysteine methyltransferase n=1 Tax=Haloplanus salinus TaxID=1126245 RepID=A0A368N7V2_9EURY|nr:5-methyltetrahydropteroyltriglutamate--homocysteine methyltransferase [Haloplanus salinus]RCU46103.1 5-methyltetrahydropteroyltriglutamate--homocysteine methyltransferase [Haloplanus salinus]